MTRAGFRQFLDRLRTGYWFLPVLGVLLAVILAQLLLQLDAQIPNESLADNRLVLSAPPEQARPFMTNMAATILTTTGIVFSLLTVPLSLAASQFGSRLLRIYLRDRTIQVVLASFVCAFVYCLLMALAIPASESVGDTPQVAITFGLVLSMAALASLLLLVQHIASALQAPNLVAAAGSELDGVIDAIFAATDDGRLSQRRAEAQLLLAQLDREGSPIHAARQGYVQAVDVEVALLVAKRHDLFIRLIRSPGHFVQAGDVVALVGPPGNVRNLAAANLTDAYRLGNLRTPAQDLEYAINQIAEVAVRAMSAAINDPYTAMTCLDHLGARLARIAARPLPLSMLYDDSGRLRLINDDHSLSDLLRAAFDLLRRASRETPEVLLSMLTAIEQIGRTAYSDEYRAELRRHVALVKAESEASSSIAWDKERVERRCDELLASLAATNPEQLKPLPI